MKRKAFIISVLLAVLSLGFAGEASAQRWGRYPRGRAYGYYRPHRRAWVAPPPVVVVLARPYYRHHYYPVRRYYGPRYYGYGRPHYRRW